MERCVASRVHSAHTAIHTPHRTVQIMMIFITRNWIVTELADFLLIDVCRLQKLFAPLCENTEKFLEMETKYLLWFFGLNWFSILVTVVVVSGLRARWDIVCSHIQWQLRRVNPSRLASVHTAIGAYSSIASPSWMQNFVYIFNMCSFN